MTKQMLMRGEEDHIEVCCTKGSPHRLAAIARHQLGLRQDVPVDYDKEDVPADG